MSDRVAIRPFIASTRLAAGPVLLAGFVAALFGSAFLLFSVQPMVSRMVLPRLGGSPAVWNTCVCFFQAALLAGYGYAHLSTTRLRPPVQVALHAGLLLAGGLLLPLSLGAEAPPSDGAPVVWLLTLLMLRVGLPFAAIAATAPLLQAWFARTSHPHARDPYFLYAASNAGSLLALLAYPTLIETTLGLPGQVKFWAVGFAATALAVLSCGAAALLRPGAGASAGAPNGLTAGALAATPLSERLRWVALAFVPSALMLAVTTHITTDVAAVPLFWVVPLAIYILTFIIAFARGAPRPGRLLLLAQVLALAAAGITAYIGTLNALAMLVPLVAFALTAAVCHGELAARRPGAQELTGYFFLISLGGAAGGLFNALLAPVLFPVPLEYPLLLAAACLLRPAPARLTPQARENWAIRGDLLLPFALVVLVVLTAALVSIFAGLGTARLAGGIVAAAGLLWFARRRVRLALALAVCLLMPIGFDAAGSKQIVRTFFGVLRVRLIPASDLVVVQHGTTAHGMQGLRDGEALTPLGYYRRDGAFGRFFAALDAQGAPEASVGVLGLGIGGLGCYARPGSAWTFYEIDPAMERVARDTTSFKFMDGCGNQPAVVLGDARLRLASGTARYDVLVVDVFSSDSVPIHLINREALALYLSRLNPGGTLAFHVSNRYLDLAPVVARLAADAGAPVRRLAVPSGADPWRENGMEVLALAAPGGNLDALEADGWDVPAPGPVLWTDERSDILGVIRWR